MPWTTPSGKTYNICLLDTNAISDIVRPQSPSITEFRWRIEQEAYVPCFAIQSMVELRRRPDLFDAFLSFFSQTPILILKDFEEILALERRYARELSINDIVLHAFLPTQHNDGDRSAISSFMLRIFSDPSIQAAEKHQIDEDQETADILQSRKANMPFDDRRPNLEDARSYARQAGVETICRLDVHHAKAERDAGRYLEIERYPALHTQLLSLYFRKYEPKRKLVHNDVMDLKIVAAAPYLDVVITDAFQAEIFRKIRNEVKGLDKLEVLTLRDLR